MIRLIVFDIDGVLTDGKIYIDQTGKEVKALRLTEIDAVNTLHKKGFLIAALTGEATPITGYFKNRFPWDLFVTGCKEKGAGLSSIAKELCVPLSEICYIGDGVYDIEAVKLAGLGVCPANAIDDVKSVADLILKKSGGEGCIDELRMYICRTEEAVKP